ncbi:MAG: hypothetical protein JXQ66_00985 [Campylobacterales bacterium]|nr:hypothetical protein [Campylobacterales bacterium]
MSHKHKTKIEKIFEHPVSGNIDTKKFLSALEHYGVEIDMTKHNRAKLFYNSGEFILALSHRNTLSKDSVSELRHFLEKVDLTPENIE